MLHKVYSSSIRKGWGSEHTRNAGMSFYGFCIFSETTIRRLIVNFTPPRHKFNSLCRMSF